jgi:hypothetical protein
LDAMIHYATSSNSVDHLPSPANVKTIFENTAKGDPVRRLMVDLYVYKGDRTAKGVMNPSLFQDTDFLEKLVPMLLSSAASPEVASLGSVQGPTIMVLGRRSILQRRLGARSVVRSSIAPIVTTTFSARLSLGHVCIKLSGVGIIRQ